MNVFTITKSLIPFLALAGLLGLSPITASAEEGRLLSANFGADNAFPRAANLFACKGAAGQDGLPVVFSEELAALPEPDDFRVVGADGKKRMVICTTFRPADDEGEQRTVLLAGEFGSADKQPLVVEVIGKVQSLDWQTSFKGANALISPLDEGPVMVLAELLDESDWDLGQAPTRFPWGGGGSCPVKGTKQVIRTVWSGGIRAVGGDEISDGEREQYVVHLKAEDGSMKEVVPFAIGDLQDQDNNHELCLAEAGEPVSVSYPEGFVEGPNGALNRDTTVLVSK